MLLSSSVETVQQEEISTSKDMTSDGHVTLHYDKAPHIPPLPLPAGIWWRGQKNVVIPEDLDQLVLLRKTDA